MSLGDHGTCLELISNMPKRRVLGWMLLLHTWDVLDNQFIGRVLSLHFLFGLELLF